MKTILQITEVTSGGVLPVLASVCNSLVNDYRVVVAYGVRADTPSDLKKYFDARVELVHIESFTRAISISSDVKAANEVIKLYKEIRPNIIHMHSTKAGYIGRIVFMLSKAKKFYTPHGYCFLKRDDSIYKRFIYQIVEWLLGQSNCTTVACGDGEWNIAKKIRRNAICINNGIVTSEIDQVLAEYSNSKHPFTVYTAGRIGPQKNPKQFNEIAQGCPEIKFVWIGDGEDKIYLTSPNIVITGFVKHEDVYRIASTCDCYISCSKWEGLPIALMEAMYMKKACIVSDVVGNNNLVVHKENGIIANTTEEFIDWILKMKTTDSFQLRKRANDLINSYYDAKCMCKKYKEIYKEK